MSFAHPAYHGGKNHPEQVTDELLCSGRHHVVPPLNPVHSNRLAPVPREVFIPTQKDRLLRRHNNARGRDDTLYKIQDFDKPCGPTGCCFQNKIKMEGYHGVCSGHHRFLQSDGVVNDPCTASIANQSIVACCNSCAGC